MKPIPFMTALALALGSMQPTQAAGIDIPVIPANHAEGGGPAISVQAPVHPSSVRSTTPEIPSVSRSVMTEGVPRPITLSQARSGQTPTNPASMELNHSSHIRLKPGESVLVPIARYQLNRIVTPFGKPVVKTTSNATTEILNNIVYVASSDEAPVTLFINEKANPGVALSITLIPQTIPAREVSFELDEQGLSGMRLPQASEEAEKWETSQPYVATIKDVMRDLALGQTPSGYSMKPVGNNTYDLPRCIQNGLAFDFSRGQQMLGHNLKVFIGVAKNTSSQPVEFKEAACGNWDVAAVAAYPRNILTPQERTEVFVIMRNAPDRTRTTPRPSLLSGGQ